MASPFISEHEIRDPTREEFYTTVPERAKMRELEARYVESQESWSSSERLVVTERDQLKQNLLSMTELPGARKTQGARNPIRKKASSPAGGNIHNNQESHDFEKVIEKLRLDLDQKDREISLLQQTVHRECLERMSLLEKMRSGKILPDMAGVTSASFARDSSWRGAGKVAGTERETASNTDEDESNREPAEQSGASQPKASFYEKLRKTGLRKPKPRK